MYYRASYRTKRLRKGRLITTAYVRQAIITGERQKPPLPTAHHHDADGLAGQKTWRTTQTTMRRYKYAI
jgi:hypothetical protein